MNGQLSIFDFLKKEDNPKQEKTFERILSVGDEIGRVVLGECRIATITEVEGLPNYPFYRTDSGGCYSVDEGYTDIEILMRKAEQEREKYKTIVPKNLSDRITIEYEPRKCDGVVLWEQIGIFDNMLFWKEDVTYQFLEPYDSEKKLRKAYEEHKNKILHDSYSKFKMIEKEHEMRRLYWSNHGFYADTEYVKVNG